MHDTIAAIATPPGQGAIGIVRLSGPLSHIIGKALFESKSPIFSDFRPYHMHHGIIRDDNGSFIDDVLCVFMPGPKSFTGEDILEIHGHGGQVVLHRILTECLGRGARLATNGEFSKRAFLNGRLDLTQAEAIMELIAAPASQTITWAGSRLEGLLSQRIRELRSKLDQLRTEMCIAVDFPEDELECLAPAALSLAVGEILDTLGELAANYARRRIWQQGALVVLAGQVNVGKSSLLNAILGISRALVTEIPGTTRDYLEEQILIEGLPVRLVDTAGLRQSNDVVERMGIERSQEMLDAADLIVLVIDALQGPSAEDAVLLSARQQLLLAINKIDLLEKAPIWTEQPPWKDRPTCFISAKNGTGIRQFLQTVHTELTGGESLNSGELIPNLRQKESLERAILELQGLLGEVGCIPYDLLGVRLDLVSSILAEITGEMTSQDLLERIFEGFCIGK